MHFLRYSLLETQRTKGIAVPKPSHSGILLVGVGNEIRGDDAVGLIVTRLLKENEELARHAAIVEETGDGTRLIELWKRSEFTILVDAVRSVSEPGHICKFEANKLPLPVDRFQNSTHAFSIPEAIELSRTMNELPKKLVVYGVEGKEFAQGLGMSPEVERAAHELVELITLEILQHHPCT
jgi:hydrogenase maturation protease